MNSDIATFELGDFTLESGVVLTGARLAYKTFGTLSPEKDNVVLYPTAFGGLLMHNEARIGEELALDPRRYFIVTVALIGNGESSSPSNTPAPFDGPRFPEVTVADNVRAQHRLVTERFAVDRLQLVIGFSMGALQAFEWAARFPDKVARMAAICGAARCSRHNYVFLSSLPAALTADGAWNNGDCVATPMQGLKAFGRIFAGWALSQAFYRDRLDQSVLGFASLDDCLEQFWDMFYQPKDPNDLLTMVRTWQRADISANESYGGDFERALGAIEAKALIMPGTTDLYFPVADNEYEIAHMRDARCVPIPSVWGHIAGDGISSQADADFTNRHIAALLDS
ncbi:alpha/beta fold hydrolase [Kaistia dalseonensis]|uniref:Homoserine O-acetyltransferase n=1 Tax=Kaistia dalseonensis TaxID=410840 RepID=A0ABU0HCY1_9HYPH|nr:alpha/beta fold hydrolase [Kaistia dalseonensis]MCX5497539.1 alpha/beta fold hydrolase [Kaistia dalseonensis]MDQ0440178.1 homoserine O-acetyltransferase [Kaistia dalseonensis]